LWVTGLSYAGTVDSIDIKLGSWNGTTFNSDGSWWNTYAVGNWAVGATEAGFGNPLLDGFNSVDLADGDYYLYMADNGDTGAQAVQITLGYSGGPSVSEVFTDSNGAAVSGSYTLVSGSGFTADLVTGPQTTHTTVGSSQVYESTGEANWIVDLNDVPEPASWILMTAGFGFLATMRRRKPTP